MNNTTYLSFDLDLWQNKRFLFNTTAANTTFTMKPVANTIVDVMVCIILFISMVGLGCTLEVTKIKSFLVKPKQVTVALFAQFGIMPLSAFCLAKVFQLKGVSAVVILICGCCPGGLLSNILTLAAQGDINLSIVMTSLSTLVSLGFMPLLLYIYCQSLPNLQIAVPYTKIIISLLLTTIPSSIGIFINHRWPQYSKTVTRVGLSIMTLTLVVLIIVAMLEIRVLVLIFLFPPLMASAALLPLIGFILGYFLSFCCRLNHVERRTVALETGCQQSQLGMAIVKTAFPPAMIGPMFLFPGLFGFFQFAEASLMVVVFRCYQRFTQKKKEYKPAHTEDNVMTDRPQSSPEV